MLRECDFIWGQLNTLLRPLATCISSLVLAPDEAAHAFTMWRRSWNQSPQTVRPRPRIRANALVDGSCFAAPFGALKIKSSGSLGGNAARCSGAAIANARPLFYRFGPDLSGL
jgi:hypothetical protein